MNQKVILITGIPGAGKSTVSEGLAHRYEKSVVISGDALRTMIKGGFKSPAKKWDEETHKQYFLSFKNGALLVKSFLDEGYHVIIDDTLHAGNLYTEWATYFEQFRPLKVLLKPNKIVALQRNRDRTSHHVDEGVIAEVYDNFNRYDYDGWVVIDSSLLSVDQTIDYIQNQWK